MGSAKTASFGRGSVQVWWRDGWTIFCQQLYVVLEEPLMFLTRDQMDDLLYGSMPGEVSVRLRESIDGRGQDRNTTKHMLRRGSLSVSFCSTSCQRRPGGMIAFSRASQNLTRYADLRSGGDKIVDLKSVLTLIREPLIRDLTQYSDKHDAGFERQARPPLRTSADLLWMIRLVGSIWMALKRNDQSKSTATAEDLSTR